MGSHSYGARDIPVWQALTGFRFNDSPVEEDFSRREPRSDPLSDLLASYTQVTGPGGGGRYEVQKQLQEGGEGKVYLCRDRKKQIPVAVKVLLPHLVSCAEPVYRFSREAAVLRELHHPLIVRFYDGPLGFYDSYARKMCSAFALEYLDGKDFFDVVQASRNVFHKSPGILSTFVVHIALALHYLHSQGFIHRDVSRENFFIQGWENGYHTGCQAVLLDLGRVGKIGELSQEDYYRDRFFLSENPLPGENPRLCEVGRRLSSPHAVFGRGGCRSPELSTGSQIDGRSDLFSLGVALYTTLEATWPYYPSFTRHAWQTPELRQPKMDHPLIPVALRLLEVRPEDRYQTGLEVAHDVVRRLSRSQRHIVRQNLLRHSPGLVNEVFG